MTRILLIATFAIVAFSDLNQADAQNRRGRFFQKIKQDLFGESQQTPTQKKASPKKPTQQTQPTRTPTLNQQRTNGSSSPSNHQRQQATVLRNQYKSQAMTARSKPATKPRPSGPPKKGFGFVVVENDNGHIVVSSVERNGNAASAGIRRGDRIKEIGGIEAASVEEFDEIAKIMSAGDQMDFKISRSGKPKTLTVQFGDSVEDVAGAESTANFSDTSQTNENRRRFDFAPPQQQNPTQSQSILNRPTSQIQARQVNSGQSNLAAGNSQIRLLNQTIEQQNRQIEMLQRQIMQMQRSQRTR